MDSSGLRNLAWPLFAFGGADGEVCAEGAKSWVGTRTRWSRWAPIHSSTKDTTAHFITENAKYKRKVWLLAISLIRLSPLLLLFPPVWILLHAVNGSSLNTMQITPHNKATPPRPNARVKEHQLGCAAQHSCCWKRGLSFPRDARVAGVHGRRSGVTVALKSGLVFY